MVNTVQDGIMAIEPTEIRPDVLIYPASATTRDRRILECVCFVERKNFSKVFLYKSPEETPGVQWIAADQIESVLESTARLPARFANQIYQAGEAGMGYYLFTLAFPFFLRRTYVVSGIVDFLYYPLWFKPGDVRAVVGSYGRARRRARPRPMPEVNWCVF
jgi:phage-related protein